MENITSVPEWNYCLNLLLDPDVSEIETNGPNEFFMKKKGQRIKIEIAANSEEAYFDGIENGLVPFVKSSNYFKRDAFLYEGRLEFTAGGIDVKGRCHIVLPPTSDTPQITIAKKTTSLVTLEAIASKGSMSTEMMQFIELLVKANQTIAFSGGTGAGKMLHKNSLISTPLGQKTISEISIGDTVFDENGEQTKVTAKYSPEEENFYELTFNNGEKIKAGGGHIWKVLELNKKQAFGYKTKGIFTDDELKNIAVALELEDNMITMSELMNIVRGNELSAHVPREEISDLIRLTIRGFGVKGGDLLAFDRLDLISKVSEKKATQRAKTVIEKLQKINTTTISLSDFKKLVGNRAFSYSVLGKVSSAEHRTYYNKNEVLSFLIKKHNERLSTRIGLDESKSNQARPTALLTTDKMFDRGITNLKGRKNFAIEKISKAVDYNEQDLIIDPYTLGAWLGDGTAANDHLTGMDLAIFDKIKLSFPEADLLRSNFNEKTEVTTNTWKIRGLNDHLQSLNLINNKHIPEIYKISSVAQRKELLAGLMDTDGSFDYKRGCAVIEMTEERIVRGAREIAASLGWKVTKVSSRERSYKNNNGEKVECKDSFQFYFYPTSSLSLQVPHKKEELDNRLASKKAQQSRHDRHYVVDIQKISGKSEDYFCLGVDSKDHTYLVGDSFIPTHNTTMLEAVAKNIPSHLRIGVAEDTPELVLTQPNVSYLHSVPWQPGTSANDVATLSWVVQQFQRMRTDKIVVGEVRGKEFADFLIAANSGMDGSFITIHSDDPVSCLRKMTNFATEARPGVPVRAINTDISTAVNIIIQLIILPDGRHRVSHISEIIPTLGNQEDAKITQEPLYQYDYETDTFYKSANVGDELRKKLISRGFDISRFLKSERDKRVKSHGASSGVTGGGSAGVSSNPAPTTRTIGNTPSQQPQRPAGRLPSFNPFGNQGGGRNI